MSAWVAFLRGMNLGGRRITNDELCAHVGALGFESVSAYQASGNVLFEADAGDAETIAARLERGLTAALDYEVPSFVRSADAVVDLADCRPFTDDLRVEGRKIQVALLRRPADASKRREAEAHGSDDDLLVARETEIFWAPRLGVGRSELDWKAIERAVGLVTVRTLGTIQRIARKLEA